MSDNEMIIRDPEKMQEFSENLESFSANITKVVDDLLQTLESANSFMKDDSRKALKEIYLLLKMILEEMPRAQSTAQSVEQSAKHLIKARSIMENLDGGRRL